MIRPRLEHRDVQLRELMDDPDCDLTALRQTYAQFRLVNRLVAGWGRVYRQRIRPLLEPHRTTTLLDVGCGGGDVPRALAGWAARDGLSLTITGIDPDERAYAYASEQPPTSGVTFRRVSSAELVAERATFDVVTSNHVLHHLDVSALAAMLEDSDRLARRLVVHNDLARGRLAYAGFAVASRPFGRRSLLSVDGLRSIRRSYRPAELRAVVPPPWRVEQQAPARLLLILDRAASESIEP